MLYVIQVKAGTEMEVLAMGRRVLPSSCYDELFVPRYLARKRYHGEWHEEKRILFPGYLFFRSICLDEIYGHLKEIPRFTRVLEAGQKAAAIYPEEEEFLRAMMGPDYVIRMSEGLIVGDDIWITKGALKDYRGKIQKIDRHRRTASLMVELYGRPTPVEVGLEVVKKVSPEEFSDWKELVRQKQGGQETEVGTRVKVLGGVFEGLEGKLLSGTGGGVVKASIELMGRDTEVEFRPDEVEVIPER